MTSLLGFFGGEVTGANERRRRQWQIARLREQTTPLVARVSSAPDERAARRILADYWRGLHQTEQQVAAGAHGTDIETAGDLVLFVQTQLSVIAAPLFDDLPIHAAGLDRVDASDAAPVWVGHPTQLLEATAGLVRRGLRLDVDRDQQQVRVHREATLIATMVGDARHVRRVAEPVAARRRPFWKPRWRVATLATIAASGSGAPYRDGHLPDRIASHDLVSGLREAGITVERRGRDLHASTGDGATLVIRGGGAPQVRIADLRLRYRDVASAVACAHALTACTGPVTVTLADRTLDATSPDGYPAWLARHRRDIDAIAALVTELDSASSMRWPTSRATSARDRSRLDPAAGRAGR